MNALQFISPTMALMTSLRTVKPAATAKLSSLPLVKMVTDVAKCLRYSASCRA